MNKEKWYKRDDVEYWKKEYLELSKQLEEKQIVLDKIKKYCKEEKEDLIAGGEVCEDILEILEEIDV